MGVMIVIVLSFVVCLFVGFGVPWLISSRRILGLLIVLSLIVGALANYVAFTAMGVRFIIVFYLFLAAAGLAVSSLLKLLVMTYRSRKNP